MGAWVLSFCYIDYLAFITFGNSGNSKDYKNFIDQKLNKISITNYNSDYIWAIRNALIHTYGESTKTRSLKLKYSFVHATPAYHNRLDIKSNSYSLNLSDFVFDLLKVTTELFEYLENLDEKTLESYIERTQELLSVYDLFGATHKTKFRVIDGILAPLDKKNVDWKKIKDTVFKLCLGKDKFYISLPSSLPGEYNVSGIGSELKSILDDMAPVIVGTSASGNDPSFLNFIENLTLGRQKISIPKDPPLDFHQGNIEKK